LLTRVTDDTVAEVAGEDVDFDRRLHLRVDAHPVG